MSVSAISPTRMLARFAATASFQDLPETVVAKTIDSTRDCLGVCLYGALRVDSGPVLARYAVQESGGAKSATVIGGGKALAEFAALANGTSALSFEFEDVHIGSQAHPYASVHPAALAMAERVGASGRECLTALAVGNEIACRIGVASRVRSSDGSYMASRRGLYPQQLFCVFGAAAAAGRLLRLDEDRMADALGIAGEQAAGTMQSHNEGAWARRLHGGLGAANGVRAALLAAAGVTGPRSVLEGKHGFYTAFDLESHPEALTAGLADQWEFLDVWYKAYPCATTAHGMLESVLGLVREHGLRASDVEGIVGIQPPWSASANEKPKAGASQIAAQYGPRMILATALVRGKYELEETHLDPEDLALVRKFAEERIEIQADERLARIRDESRPLVDPVSPGETGRTSPGAAEIVLKDGSRLFKEVLFPLGSPRNPMNEAALRKKFDRLVLRSGICEADAANSIWNTVGALTEDIPVAELMEKLRR